MRLRRSVRVSVAEVEQWAEGYARLLAAVDAANADAERYRVLIAEAMTAAYNYRDALYYEQDAVRLVANVVLGRAEDALPDDLVAYLEAAASHGLGV